MDQTTAGLYETRVARCGHEYEARITATVQQKWCPACLPPEAEGQCSFQWCDLPRGLNLRTGGLLRTCEKHRFVERPKTPAPTACRADGCQSPPRPRVIVGGQSPKYCAEHTTLPKVAPGKPRQCAECGATYVLNVAPGASHKYCSKACASAPGKCVQCGGEVPVTVRGRYCSAACKRAHRPPCSMDGCSSPWFAKGLCQSHYNNQNDTPRWKWESWISPDARAAIYRRDKWVCQICHRKVDPLATVRDEWASLDHIVPRSQGGTDDPANLRLAHYGCNVRRGNRGGGEQLALLG